MSVAWQIFWWSLLLLGVAGSALFSGIETGVYNVNRVRLHLFEHQGKTSARILSRMLLKPMPMLATLLIANNISNYLGTSALTLLLQGGGYTDGQIVIINVLIITPLLFVFGETLPKDLFAAHSDRWTYVFIRPLNGLKLLFTFTLVLPLVLAFTRVTMWAMGMASQPQRLHPRLLVGHLMKEGVGYGVVSDEQSAIVERVLSLANRTVRDEMIKWQNVRTVPHNATTDFLLMLANTTSHSRFPVVDADGSVKRVLNITHVLAHPRDAVPPLSQIAKPALFLEARTPVRAALRTMQTSHAGLAVVRDGGRHVGIVTMKDLVEPITGELRGW